MRCKNCGSNNLSFVEEGVFVCNHCLTRNIIEVKPAQIVPEEPVHQKEDFKPSQERLDYDLLAKAIVRIKTPTGTGTGFFINNQGQVITNAHVVEDLEIVQGFIGSSPILLEFECIADGQVLGYDLALLQLVSDHPFHHLSFSDESPRMGDEIIVIGNPKNLGISINKGIISRLEQHSFQLDVTVNPGNSGSPVINDKGEVVGVISYAMEEIKGLSFAVGLKAIKHFSEEALTLEIQKDVLNIEPSIEIDSSDPEVLEEDMNQDHPNETESLEIHADENIDDDDLYEEDEDLIDEALDGEEQDLDEEDLDEEDEEFDKEDLDEDEENYSVWDDDDLYEDEELDEELGIEKQPEGEK